MIYLGADHRGFEKKAHLVKFLTEKNIKFEDLGSYKYDQSDDYNDPAIAVAKSVRKSLDNKGILICGSAHGVTIQANRFKNIRAITATSAELIKLGREHNNANILCLSADFLTDEEIKNLVETFLATPFSNETRHIKRINRLDEREDYA